MIEEADEKIKITQSTYADIAKRSTNTLLAFPKQSSSNITIKTKTNICADY